MFFNVLCKSCVKFDEIYLENGRILYGLIELDQLYPMRPTSSLKTQPLWSYEEKSLTAEIYIAGSKDKVVALIVVTHTNSIDRERVKRLCGMRISVSTNREAFQENSRPKRMTRNGCVQFLSDKFELSFVDVRKRLQE